MGESDYQIDDVLFLRALASAGDRAVETFDSLVSNLEQCLESSGLLTSDIRHQKSLLRSKRRSVLHASISDGSYPIVMVGVRSGNTPLLFVVIQTDPRNPAKNHVKSTLDLRKRVLWGHYERGQRWNLRSSVC